MLIKEIFATKVEQRIEPVVKVADQSTLTLLNELSNLVVTPQWERHIHRVLDAYTDAAEREQEQGIGIWISGFFGSGKSLLMKMLGVLLAGGELQGKSVHDLFLARLGTSTQDVDDIRRYLAICRRKINTSVVGGNLHSMLVSGDDRLPLITFKLFAEQRGYTHSWPLAWSVEYQIDERGKSDLFRERAAELTGTEWEDIKIDPEIYLDDLYQAASDTLPELFQSAASAMRAAEEVNRSGIDAHRVIGRFKRWCEARDADGKRHKLFLQLDELGQWIAAGNANDRTMQVQALVEQAAEAGSGRIWIAVTAHGDIQALQQNVQQENYAKIMGRFGVVCRLSNEDISRVVEERVLRKTLTATAQLIERFNARSGEITDLGRLERVQRVYHSPDPERFALFYPYLPWTVEVIPDVVKGIAQAAKRDESLSGSNRTMIAVVQGALLETPSLLTSTVGRIVSLADLYAQLSSDVPVETKTDLSRIEKTVPDATPFTTRVAQALFLLGEAEYIETSLDNVTRALVDTLDVNVATLRARVRDELKRLVDAGYAKQVGDLYRFLNTQQRTFQDKIRARHDELTSQSYELSQKLRDKDQGYTSDRAMLFDRVSFLDRELQVKLELDGGVIRNPTAQVTVRIASPLQRALDPQISDDATMRQRSAQEVNAIFLRMAEVDGFRSALALAMATQEIADSVLSSGKESNAERDVSQQAKQQDLPDLRKGFSTLLAQSVRNATLFFRGKLYNVGSGDNAADGVRATLATILPDIYPRFNEVPQRIVNEQTAVRAALSGNSTNADLKSLDVFRADGSLNENHVLLSLLRANLPMSADQPAINAAELRRIFEEPPYGWDGNVVKVGLALLLRSSACRLIEGSQFIADPTKPRAEEVLTKDILFKSIRVQGLQTDLAVPELLEIRGAMQQVLQTPGNTALVAATLNGALAIELGKLAERMNTVAEWAKTLSCPIPLTFISGQSAVQELLQTGAAPLRLRAFRDQREALAQVVGQLATLEQFRAQESSRFTAVRDYYNSMINVLVKIPPLQQFIKDYRTVEQDRSLTLPPRWQELIKSYNAAREGVDGYLTEQQADVADRLQALEAELTSAVTAVGVPDEAVAAKTAELVTLYDSVRQRLERGINSFLGVQELRDEWNYSKAETKLRLDKWRDEYAVQDDDDKGDGGKGTATRVSWRTLVGAEVTVTSDDEVDALLDTLRARLRETLAQSGPVTLE